MDFFRERDLGSNCLYPNSKIRITIKIQIKSMLIKFIQNGHFAGKTGKMAKYFVVNEM